MPKVDDITESLTTEILVEMADSFFGSRKAIDDEKERFNAQAAKVESIYKATLERFALLHSLLLEEKYVEKFYRALGMNPGQFIHPEDPPSTHAALALPFALTHGKRYEKLLIRSYGETANAVDGYLHGRYYNDPQTPGRKRLSPGYDQMRAWAEKINQSVKKVNEGHAPSSVLNFSKSLDGSQMQHESISEATINGYSSSLDQSMALAPLKFQDYGLAAIPELPAPDAVKKDLAAFARGLYKQHKERINALLEHLKT